MVLSVPGIERPFGATSLRSSPGVPVNSLVVLLLQAGDTDPVDVGATDHAETDGSAGEGPAVLFVDVDADQPEILDLLTDLEVDLTAHVHEAALLGEQFVVEVTRLGVVEPEERLHQPRRTGLVGDELGVDADRVGRHGQRQFLPIAIEDRPAIGSQGCRSAPLGVAGAAQRRSPGGLDLGDLEQHAAEHDQQEHEQQLETS